MLFPVGHRLAKFAFRKCYCTLLICIPKNVYGKVENIKHAQSIQNTYQVPADKNSYQSSKGLNFHLIPGYPGACHFSIFRASREAAGVSRGEILRQSGAGGADWFALARVLSTGTSET